MKSITIHKVEDPLWAMLKSKAEAEGLSLNKTIKKLLESSLGITPKAVKDKRSEFSEFLGCWSKSEAKEFSDNISDLGKVNPEDWS